MTRAFYLLLIFTLPYCGIYTLKGQGNYAIYFETNAVYSFDESTNRNVNNWPENTFIYRKDGEFGFIKEFSLEFWKKLPTKAVSYISVESDFMNSNGVRMDLHLSDSVIYLTDFTRSKIYLTLKPTYKIQTFNLHNIQALISMGGVIRIGSEVSQDPLSLPDVTISKPLRDLGVHTAFAITYPLPFQLSLKCEVSFSRYFFTQLGDPYNQSERPIPRNQFNVGIALGYQSKDPRNNSYFKHFIEKDSAKNTLGITYSISDAISSGTKSSYENLYISIVQPLVGLNYERKLRISRLSLLAESSYQQINYFNNPLQKILHNHNSEPTLVSRNVWYNNAGVKLNFALSKRLELSIPLLATYASGTLIFHHMENYVEPDIVTKLKIRSPGVRIESLLSLKLSGNFGFTVGNFFSRYWNLNDYAGLSKTEIKNDQRFVWGFKTGMSYSF